MHVADAGRGHSHERKYFISSTAPATSALSASGTAAPQSGLIRAGGDASEGNTLIETPGLKHRD